MLIAAVSAMLAVPAPVARAQKAFHPQRIRYAFFEAGRFPERRPIDELLALREATTTIRPGEAAYDRQLDSLKAATIFLARSGDQVAGFVGARVYEQHPVSIALPETRGLPSGYFTLDTVHPDHRGSGLYRRLNRLRADWLFTRKRVPMIHLFTQNPKVFLGTEEMLKESVARGLIRSYRLILAQQRLRLYEGKPFAPVDSVPGSVALPSVFSEMRPNDGDTALLAWKVEY